VFFSAYPQGYAFIMPISIEEFELSIFPIKSVVDKLKKKPGCIPLFIMMAQTT